MNLVGPGIRLGAAVLVFASLGRAQGVTLNNSFPEGVRGVLQMAANEVWSIVGAAFQSKAPLNLPIECYVNPITPITGLDNWTHPTRILIGVKISGYNPPQFAIPVGP